MYYPSESNDIAREDERNYISGFRLIELLPAIKEYFERGGEETEPVKDYSRP